MRTAKRDKDRDTPFTLDIKRHTRKLQKSSGGRPLEKRGELRFPTSLEDFVTEPKHRRKISLIASARCIATQKLHDTLLTKVKKFCKTEFNRGILTLTSEDLLDFLWECEEKKVKTSYVAGLAGAISFLVATMKIQDPWDAAVQRAYMGLHRRTACEKPPTRKAPMLPLWVLQRAVEKFLLINIDKPDYIKIPTFRALILQILQMKLLARVEDLRKLRAVDLEDVKVGEKRAIAVRFRTAKNDPSYVGGTSYIIETGGTHCAYMLLKTYMTRMRFAMMGSGIIDTSFIFPRTSNEGFGQHRLLIPDGRYAVATDTLFRDINKLYEAVGYYIKTTGKSAKVLGVTLAYSLGLSDDEVRILGRWRSIHTAQHYRNVEPRKIIKISNRIRLQENISLLQGNGAYDDTLDDKTADDENAHVEETGDVQHQDQQPEQLRDHDYLGTTQTEQTRQKEFFYQFIGTDMVEEEAV
jgi:hypothetical protein